MPAPSRTAAASANGLNPRYAPIDLAAVSVPGRTLEHSRALPGREAAVNALVNHARRARPVSAAAAGLPALKLKPAFTAVGQLDWPGCVRFGGAESKIAHGDRCRRGACGPAGGGVQPLAERSGRAAGPGGAGPRGPAQHRAGRRRGSRGRSRRSTRWPAAASIPAAPATSKRCGRRRSPPRRSRNFRSSQRTAAPCAPTSAVRWSSAR